MDVNRNPLTTDHLSIGRGYKHQILTHYLPFNPFFFFPIKYVEQAVFVIRVYFVESNYICTYL